MQINQPMIFLAILSTLPALASAFMGPAYYDIPLLARDSKSTDHNVLSKKTLRTANKSQLRMGLLDLSFGSSTKSSINKDYCIEVNEEVGSGSYGIVHLCKLVPNDGNDNNVKIAKRAWTEEELLSKAIKDCQDATPDNTAMKNDAKERSERCEYYIDVERHCLDKLASSDDSKVKKYVPNLIGLYQDNNDDSKNEWLVFDLVSSDGSSTPSDQNQQQKAAPTLQDILEEDWIDQHAQDEADQKAHHHLYVLQKAFGMQDIASFGDVLDKVLLNLLRAVSAVNSNNVVHRDVKPGNLLVHSGEDVEGSFILIDFGSGECQHVIGIKSYTAS